ncbi:aminopeptidase N-like isoform X1 [Haliotis rufescens]|uniref:aminopeptidase N-like isoform X1 n=1 Tax=Haliotis rufescens TaxID=6454 RepID=UPI00201FAAA2|nr:aminopeptidase N-like isoform X1 [Haliotis rufescens]
MRDYTVTDTNGTTPNGTAPMSDEKRSGGVYISHGVGFILLLLAACLAVLVGLVVHLVSPGQVICTCDTPTVATPPLKPEELRARCVGLVDGGDLKVCDACSKKTTTAAATATATATAPTTTTTTTTPAPIINYRLPTAVKPYHYVLELQPEIYGTNSSLFTFNGTVSIVLNVTEATSNVTLHKNDLTIDNDSLSFRPLDNLSDRGPAIVSTSYDEVREFYVLHLDNDLQPGRSYEVGMSFQAKMRTDGLGLYLSSYKTDLNETIYLASTQFEAPHARKAFPCFDEPALKATFDITLVKKVTTGRNYRTLTNTEAVSSETRGNYTADKFATTPVMSTYLLAFIVCDFDQWENTTSNITYRTLARPNALQHADRAQKYGIALFDWFEKTFEPDYPITKLDNIAIPDFTSGAMENWGLITYRETLLYEVGVSTASQDSWIVEVISHEITHQWFGNIVSPKWWWWLWLNESFASFWDFHAVEAIYPRRRSTEQFVVQSMHAAMVVDGVQTSHPMTNDVESNAEVEGSFDTITYSKGACVVRMMHFTMGEELFIRGLNLYLKRHQYGVAEHKDLFNALTEQSVAEGTPINMTDIFEPWVTQMNYPLVTVRVTGPGTIHVRQERFLNNMSSNTTGDTAPYGYKWTIPITIASSKNSSNLNKKYSYNDIVWLAKTEADKNIIDPVVPDPSQNDAWVVVNVQQYGYYRVNYEERNWMALVKQLELDHTVFPPLTRAQLINDAWALQQTGLVTMGIALRTLNFLKNDVDYVSWRAFTRHDDYLIAVVEQSQFYGAFREFMRVSANKTYNHYRMNIQDDTLPIDIFQISRGSNYACTFGVQECMDDALRLYREWMMDTVNNRIDPNLMDVVTCNAVRYGGIEEWNFAYSQYQQSNTIRGSSFYSLFCTTQPWLLQRMLDKALDNTTFPSSHAVSVIYNVGQNAAAREMTWNFIKSNFLTLHNKLGQAALSALITNLPSGYNKEYFVNELQSFANTTQAEAYQTSFQEAIKKTQADMDWLETNGDVIKEWLTEQGFGEYLPY